MTARQLVLAGRRYSVDGEGYSTDGQDPARRRRAATSTLEPFMLPMALANDAVIRDGECIGDPTEGALVVLAAKGGLDVDETRRTYPRVAEVPFDTEYKLMATFHEIERRRAGRALLRQGRARRRPGRGPPSPRAADGSPAPIDGRRRERVLAENDRLAGRGTARARGRVGATSIAATFDPIGDLLGARHGPRRFSRWSASSTRRARRRRTRSRCARTPASGCG